MDTSNFSNTFNLFIGETTVFKDTLVIHKRYTIDEYNKLYLFMLDYTKYNRKLDIISMCEETIIKFMIGFICFYYYKDISEALDIFRKAYNINIEPSLETLIDLECSNIPVKNVKSLLE